MSDEDTGATDEMTDAQFDEFLDTEDAAAESEINAQDSADLADDGGDDADIDESGDVDDSPTNLHASLGLSDADQYDLDAEDADEPNVIEPMTDAQLLADEKIRAKNRRDPARIVDNMNEQTGPRVAASRWARHLESERRASIDATSPDAEAEREAKAVAGVAKYMEAEDADEGPGVISGDDTKPDHADAVQRRKNAMANWDAFCDDPDS